MRQRVVITGIGLICGAGSSPEAFGEALAGGKTGFVRLIDPRLAHLKASHASLVDTIPQTDGDGRPEGADRAVQLALYALDRAIVDAGLAAPLGARFATVLGTCSGSMLTVERQAERRMTGAAVSNPDAYTAARSYSIATAAALRSGALGLTSSVVTACAAGTGAAAYGADLIRLGWCDGAIVGGADAFAPSTLVGFDALKATCEGVCAPFSENIGLNLGEGAAFLVLESLERAERRGAKIWGEILGSGLSNDAHHATSPDPAGRGQLAAMERALSDAGILPDAVSYVNAHGTGTRANDSVESRAVTKLLGDRVEAVPVSSIKSMIGHCLGAAGALEAAATLIAARRGIVPPTAGFTGAREGCTLDYVPDAGRPSTGTVTLSNSFGFGGNNACLVLESAPLNRDEYRRSGSEEPVRPVITGWGAVHALGVGELEDLYGDRSGISEITRFPANAEERAGMVPEMDFRAVDRRIDFRNMDRFAKYLTVATRAALRHADFPLRPSVTANVGMITGLSYGPGAAEDAHVRDVIRNDYRLDRVDAFPYVVQNAAAGHTARALLLKGHNTVLSVGWGAGLSAAIAATAGIAAGHGDALVAAAADELIENGFRDGMSSGVWEDAVPGEGAGALLLEHPRAAAERGAKTLGEILACAAAAEPLSGKCITGESLHRALDEALARAGISGRSVNRIASAGSATAAGAAERRIGAALCPNAQQETLAHRIGFAEASLCLIALAGTLSRSAPGDIVAAISLSREGAAHAVLVRRR